MGNESPETTQEAQKPADPLPSEQTELQPGYGIWQAFLPRQAAIAEAIRIAANGFPAWQELIKGIDLQSLSTLYVEAVRATNLVSAVSLQRIAFQLGHPLPRASSADLIVAPSPEVPTLETSPLENELRELRQEVEQKSQALFEERASNKESEQRIQELDEAVKKLGQRERLAFLLSQVHPAARRLLERSDAFRDRFLLPGECTGFVVSVDMRRSTDLMLKARRPEQFSSFISSLCQELAGIVLNSFGVFDKFTGDGILAFFPEFYSGPDAGYYALSAAERCHAAFESHYEAHRTAFNSVLRDVGLGIGVDFGKFNLVQVSGGLTVVGTPVVYACRMGGAPAGLTLLNQPAFEVISERYGGRFYFEETEILLKHEGPTLAYRVRSNSRTFEPALPDWMSEEQDAVKKDD